MEDSEPRLASSLPHVFSEVEEELANLEAELVTEPGIVEAELEAEEVLVQSGPQQFLDMTDAWQLSLLVICSINISLVACYWFYLLYSSYTHTIRWRPPLLPHSLLLGLSLASCAGFPYLTAGVEAACLGSRLTGTLAYAIIYSSLLVRLVCLRSLHRGVFLPTPYQALLLWFCILVQVALCGEWLVDRQQPCVNLQPYQHVISHTYPAILFLAVLVLAGLFRNAREHYGEARNIFYTVLTHLPVWIAWPAAAIIIDTQLHIICGLGLQGVVLLTLLVLFLPRARHLVYLSRDGYNKFEDDPYSVNSDPYSVHFGGKSMKWEQGGLGGHRWTPAPTHKWAHKYDSKLDGSYLGFHRPTRVVPPSSNSSPSHSTFSPGLIYPDKYSPVYPEMYPTVGNTEKYSPYTALYTPHSSYQFYPVYGSRPRSVYPKVPTYRIKPIPTLSARDRYWDYKF